jgi:hypothetical protein
MNIRFVCLVPVATYQLKNDHLESIELYGKDICDVEYARSGHLCILKVKIDRDNSTQLQLDLYQLITFTFHRLPMENPRSDQRFRVYAIGTPSATELYI